MIRLNFSNPERPTPADAAATFELLIVEAIFGPCVTEEERELAQRVNENFFLHATDDEMAEMSRIMDTAATGWLTRVRTTIERGGSSPKHH